MKATFENTMDILVKAYLNDTLKHGDSASCAVGNICNGEKEWAHLFVTLTDSHEQIIASDGQFISHKLFENKTTRIPKDEIEMGKLNFALEVVNKTGYSVKELAKIEYAFETALKGESNDDWMFNSLLAVLEVVAEIHGVDFDSKKVYEDKFQEIFATK